MLGSVMFASKILLLYKNICDIFLTYLGIYNHFDLDFTKVISALLRMVLVGTCGSHGTIQNYSTIIDVTKSFVCLKRVLN